MAKTNKPRLLQFYFPSATNHQSVKRLQAVWLVGNEIGFTLERTQRTELLFFNRIPGTLLKSPVRSHLQVLWAGLCLRDRKGRREEYGSEEIWKKECKLCLSGEGRELSGTPVRRMSKVHLFIPSSFVRCHSLKTGLSENTAHLFLPASVTLSLCFFTQI